MSDRTLQLKVLLSSQEKRWLKQISDAKGLTVSDELRQHLRSEFDRLVEAGQIFEQRVGAKVVSKKASKKRSKRSKKLSH